MTYASRLFQHVNIARMSLGSSLEFGKSMKFITFLLLVSASLMLSQTALAETVSRSGLTGGVSLGGSAVSDGGVGLASELHLGFMVSPDTALYAEASGTVVASGASTGDALNVDSYTVLGVGAKQWLQERLWAKATLGAGQLAGNIGNEDVDETGPAMAAALGFSITPGGTLNVIARGSVGVFSDHTIIDAGLLLGVQF